VLRGCSSNSVISIGRGISRHSAVDHIKTASFTRPACFAAIVAKSEYAAQQQEAAVVQASAGSPEKAAYNVFIAVLPGKKVALCAVGRNFDMMSDFLHAAESSSKRCSKDFRA
jgi:hypothetical protein